MTSITALTGGNSEYKNTNKFQNLHQSNFEYSMGFKLTNFLVLQRYQHVNSSPSSKKKETEENTCLKPPRFKITAFSFVTNKESKNLGRFYVPSRTKEFKTLLDNEASITGPIQFEQNRKAKKMKDPAT